MRNPAQQLVAIEQIRADLLQSLDEVEQAATQKRPLRLAYFIARLKSRARIFFLAEESLLGSAGEPSRAERGGSANQDIWLSEISASMGDGNRLPRSRSNEKTSP